MVSEPSGGPARDKLHYKPAEVCALTETQPYVLKFWEQEFPQIAAERNRSGQRLYRKRDVELVRRIKYLLHEKEYTIAAVRRLLEQGSDLENVFPEEPPGTLPVPRAAAGRREGTARPADRGDVREDLSGLLFEDTTAMPGLEEEPGRDERASREDRELQRAPGAGAGEGGPLAGIVDALDERIRTEMETLRADRNRLGAESAALRQKLRQARREIRDLVEFLESRRRSHEETRRP
jgi:DNA-binding transcriptional MerR regulator